MSEHNEDLDEDIIGHRFPIEVELSEPIQNGKKGKVVDRLIIREPVFGDLSEIVLTSGVDFESILTVFARICTNLPKGEARVYINKVKESDGDIGFTVARDFLLRRCQ